MKAPGNTNTVFILRLDKNTPNQPKSPKIRSRAGPEQMGPELGSLGHKSRAKGLSPKGLGQKASGGGRGDLC